MRNSEPRVSLPRSLRRRMPWRLRVRGSRVCPSGLPFPSRPWCWAGVGDRSGRSRASGSRTGSRGSGSMATAGSCSWGAPRRLSMVSASASRCSGPGVPSFRGVVSMGGCPAWSSGGTSAMRERCAGCGSLRDGAPVSPPARPLAAHSENPVNSREPFGETHGLCALVTRRSRNGAGAGRYTPGAFFGQAHRASRETRRFWNMVHE